MDALSLRVANLLVANAEDAAALELTLLGPTLQFEQDALIAICGGDFAPRVDGSSVPLHRPVWIKSGSTLSFGAARQGCRAYLAIAGGIEVPEILGSRGTYLRAGIGGLDGRALEAVDLLAAVMPDEVSQRFAACLARERDVPYVSVPWQAALQVYPAPSPELRAIRGAEFESLTPESQKRLFSNDFEVTSQSDRMGYRLAGPNLELSQTRDLISSAVCPGTLQLPPEGQPILLMADAATTGGYPKIAHLASVDLPAAAQLRPGDFFRLREISLEEAHNLYRQQEAALQCLKTGLRLKLTLPKG
jgi:antagonist of KipI